MSDLDNEELIATRKLNGLSSKLYEESSTNIKEMQYQATEKIEVLATGYFFGLLYYILNLGTHPTAYIKIPESSNLLKNKKNMYELDIDVHGGITYAREYLYISENKKIDGYFIGWDYAHYGDYAGYEEMLPLELRTGGKKWTTQEILKEVKEACYQIVTAEREEKVGMSNIEENIKRCEQLTEAKHSNWIGISNQVAIAHIVDRIKELEENSIPKQKVINLIENETINISGFKCVAVEELMELLEEK